MIIGAPISDERVDIGSGYVHSDERMSQTSNKFAPINAQAGSVSRWFVVWNSPRAICGTATPTKAIGPQKAVIPPTSSPVANTIAQRMDETRMPNPCA